MSSRRVAHVWQAMISLLMYLISSSVMVIFSCIHSISSLALWYCSTLKNCRHKIHLTILLLNIQARLFKCYLKIRAMQCVWSIPVGPSLRVNWSTHSSLHLIKQQCTLSRPWRSQCAVIIKQIICYCPQSVIDWIRKATTQLTVGSFVTVTIFVWERNITIIHCQCYCWAPVPVWPIDAHLSEFGDMQIPHTYAESVGSESDARAEGIKGYNGRH